MQIATVLRYVDQQKGDVWDDRWYIMDDFMRLAQQYGVGLTAVMTAEAAKDICRMSDGLIIPGSATDIDPKYFGGTPFDPPTKVDEYALDALLIKLFYEAGKPIFGVCGGEQALNVYFGGTLKRVPDSKQHDDQRSRHVIDIARGSFVDDVFHAEKFEVNSYHNWCVDKVAPGFEAVAWAPDGVVEAIEWKEKKIFATQWHPELSFRFGEKTEHKFSENFLRACEGKR